MNKKTISIISYLAIVGWTISFLIYHIGGRSSFAQYHLKQSFGLHIFTLILCVFFIPIIGFFPVVSTFFGIVSFCILIITVFGVINAVKLKTKPIPLIGTMFVNRFKFIKY